MLRTMNYKMRIMQRIKKMKTKSSHIDIFKCIIKGKIKYTVNQNGVFFYLTTCSDDIVEEIDRILKTYEKT